VTQLDGKAAHLVQRGDDGGAHETVLTPRQLT
jgi:hypothetical protein